MWLQSEGAGAMAVVVGVVLAVVAEPIVCLLALVIQGGPKGGVDAWEGRCKHDVRP